MPKYMMILHDSTTALAAFSPEEIQRIVQRYQKWSGKVAAAGKLAGGEKLRDEGGRHLTAAGGKLVVRDGPYAEVKEIIGGYFIIEAADYDEAVRLSSDCPHLALGGRIELREVEAL
jgi:hypothetical protein